MFRSGTFLPRVRHLRVRPGQQGSAQEDVGNSREKTEDCAVQLMLMLLLLLLMMMMTMTLMMMLMITLMLML